MKSKIVLLTGATSGIGTITAREIASKGATLVLVARNEAKAKQLTEKLKSESENPNIEYIIGDLSLLKEVEAVANSFLKKYDTLDVLINNAGIVKDTLILTNEGHELMMATNHYASFLLTHLLLDALKKSKSARIVNVASDAHKFGKLDLNDMAYSSKKFSMGPAYGASKIAMISSSYVLAEKLKESNIAVNALHPGVIKTNFGQGQKLPFIVRIMDLFMTKLTPEEGAKTQIMLATSDKVEGITGKYWNEKGEQKSSSKRTQNMDFAQKVYDLTYETVGLK